DYYCQFWDSRNDVLF
nr:immunoglobulin light chain junction region [Macaca mulatta]MOW01667.1 immunoglobulin light chain junction region [Macaca mulatta]